MIEVVQKLEGVPSPDKYGLRMKMFRCRHQLVSTCALLAAAAGLSVSCTLVSLKPHSSYAFLALAVYASFVTWQHYIGPPLLHFRNCIPGPAARKGQTEPQSHFCF